MSVIYILIAISMIVAGCFLAAFLWAVKSGQYDDNHTPAVRILFEDKVKNKNVNKADFRSKFFPIIPAIIIPKLPINSKLKEYFIDLY